MDGGLGVVGGEVAHKQLECFKFFWFFVVQQDTLSAVEIQQIENHPDIAVPIWYCWNGPHVVPRVDVDFHGNALPARMKSYMKKSDVVCFKLAI